MPDLITVARQIIALYKQSGLTWDGFMRAVGIASHLIEHEEHKEGTYEQN